MPDLRWGSLDRSPALAGRGGRERSLALQMSLESDQGTVGSHRKESNVSNVSHGKVIDETRFSL